MCVLSLRTRAVFMCCFHELFLCAVSFHREDVRENWIQKFKMTHQLVLKQWYDCVLLH